MDPHIAVIGLGYVGLPLAAALARHYPVLGFDISQSRVDELRRHHDRTGELTASDLAATRWQLSAAPIDLQGQNIFIVTVPTPVTADNKPDLGYLTGACAMLGPALIKGGIVVFESTVYPGVTEDICGPALEKASGLKAGVDFFLGYSPERINPGDKEHTIDRIIKVVAGQTPDVTEKLAEIYGKITSAGVFVAANIKTAEAAKVIENAQRDINIAFINEVAIIAQHMDLNSQDILDAANTKWNFLDFRPGLVGGHCIGVDPYYLAFRSKELGHEPEIILSGRRLNDDMGAFIANRIHMLLGGSPQKILVLGLTFKENVPDLRNSRVIDIIRALQAHGHQVNVHDAMADAAEAEQLYGLTLLADMASAGPYDAVIGAVRHENYLAMTAQDFDGLLRPGGLVADVKNLWRSLPLPGTFQRWAL